MALDDFMESDVAVAVAATAVVLSPAVRKLLRRGAVFGISKILEAGTTIAPNGLEDITAQPAKKPEGAKEKPVRRARARRESPASEPS